MLCLTRKKGQSIIIDGDIKVTILDINGAQIRLGFDAPREVGIWREEVMDRIQEEAGE